MPCRHRYTDDSSGSTSSGCSINVCAKCFCFCCLLQQEAQQEVTFLCVFIYENSQSVYYLAKIHYNRNRLAALVGKN